MRALIPCAAALVLLAACVSYPPYAQDNEGQTTTPRGDQAFGLKGYNLAHVTTWSVEGNWSDEEGSTGRIRQAVGDGPWKVLVLLHAETKPREHVVRAGGRVGEWGEDMLMIDTGAGGSSAPEWVSRDYRGASIEPAADEATTRADD